MSDAIPENGNSGRRRLRDVSLGRKSRVVLAGLVSLIAFQAVRSLPSDAVLRNADEMARAGRIMERAILVLRDLRDTARAPIDAQIDPNRTGLIGPEFSPLTTTLGELEAKRTTTNPNLAGLIVHLLDQAGVRSGDTVAIGSSGSFPALLIASLAAAKAMDVRAVAILSLGSSSYGAADPGFTLLDIYGLMQREGICSRPPAAVSLGGDRDTGADWDPDVRDRVIRRIQAAGVRFLLEPDLQRNVAERMRIYRDAASGRIAAFINSGGGYANLGTSPLVLEVRPGLNTGLPLPPAAARGVLYAMAEAGVPVIHLLFIKGLAMRFGLPWDPVPLPEPGVFRPPGAARTAGFWLVAATWFLLLLGLAVVRR